MVETICPYCGMLMDGRPNCDDVDQWYARYHPHLEVGSVVPAVCHLCSHTYAVGDAVVLRAETAPTQHTVVAVVSSPHQPDVVSVRHADGQIRCYAKSQIQPVVPQRVSDGPDLPKPEGFF